MLTVRPGFPSPSSSTIRGSPGSVGNDSLAGSSRRMPTGVGVAERRIRDRAVDLVDLDGRTRRADRLRRHIRQRGLDRLIGSLLREAERRLVDDLAVDLGEVVEAVADDQRLERDRPRRPPRRSGPSVQRAPRRAARDRWSPGPSLPGSAGWTVRTVRWSLPAVRTSRPGSSRRPSPLHRTRRQRAARRGAGRAVCAPLRSYRELRVRAPPPVARTLRSGIEV